jgi:hypothetical protein
MIKVSLDIKNPWSRDLPMHNYLYKHKRLSKNKSFEIQIHRSSPYNLFRFFVNLAWRGEDHAGPELEVELGKYCFNVKVYDHRHWDYETGTWEVYDPNKENENDI